MPEILFYVRWPDDTVETCYSPSTVIRSHLEVGRAYTVGEFVAASRRGLQAASDRVREVYGGHGCSRAMGQLAAIEQTAARYANTQIVRVEGGAAACAGALESCRRA